jgi:hypothetical protein
MDGDILGPSDLRKNQLLRHKLMYGETSLYRFLDDRVTKSRSEIGDYLINEIAQLNIDPKLNNIMVNGVLTFFEQPKSLEIEFVDFSIANIIYSGLAREHFNSMTTAGKLMAKVLDIPEDAVICSSDESLYLTAQTESGHTILDEGDIVEWSNPDDKIVSINLLNKHGKSTSAVLSQQASRAIVQASLIIYSSGTQWSSLIPTYEHLGFKSAVTVSIAKQFLIMNTTQDKDALGVDGNEMLDILSGYLNLSQTTVISPDSGVMEVANRDYVKIIRTSIGVSLPGVLFFGDPVSTKHNPISLVKTIFTEYFAEVLRADQICFDFDDTLVARDGKFVDVSEENIKLLAKLSVDDRYSICTGNSSKALLQKAPLLKNTIIYSERGVNKTINGHVISSLQKYVFDDYEIDIIIQRLQDAGIPLSKIQNRNNTIIAIKPIANEYKDAIFSLLTYMFHSYKLSFEGKTTIEISKYDVNKSLIVVTWFADKKLAYIGDEYANGNDAPLFKNPKIVFIPVDSIYTTNQLLQVLLWQN